MGGAPRACPALRASTALCYCFLLTSPALALQRGSVLADLGWGLGGCDSDLEAPPGWGPCLSPGPSHLLALPLSSAAHPALGWGSRDPSSGALGPPAQRLALPRGRGQCSQGSRLEDAEYTHLQGKQTNPTVSAETASPEGAQRWRRGHGDCLGPGTKAGWGSPKAQCGLSALPSQVYQVHPLEQNPSFRRSPQGANPASWGGGGDRPSCSSPTRKLKPPPSLNPNLAGLGSQSAEPQWGGRHPSIIAGGPPPPRTPGT